MQNTNITQPNAKKSNNKKWWIGGFALILVIAISGAIFSSIAQKMSTSKADTANTKSAISSIVPKLCKVAGVDKPCPRKPIAPKSISPKTNVKPETNPYTGEKI